MSSRRLRLSSLAFLFFCPQFHGVVSDDVSQVLSIIPKTELEIGKIVEARSRFVLDFWSGENRVDVGKPVDVRASGDELKNFKDYLRGNSIQYTIQIENVDAFIAEQALVSSRTAVSERSVFNFHDYHQVSLMEKQLLAWERQYGVKRAFAHSIGSSFQGRDILGMKVSFGETDRPLIVIEAGIHAREWISPATAMYIIDQLLKSGPDSPVAAFDWFIIPVLNPDGYEYSFSRNQGMFPLQNIISWLLGLNQDPSDRPRLWRKNRATFPTTACVGVDLNRNFPTAWGEPGGSTDPCSELYQGPRAASEPESRALMQYLSTNTTKIAAFLSLHSYGSKILFPWGHSKNMTEHYEDQMHIGKAMEAGIRKSALNQGRNSYYSVDAAARGLYVSSGISIDYTYHVLKIKYSYVVELPGFIHDQDHKFLLPASYIKPIGSETFAGLESFAVELSKRNIYAL